MWAVMTAQKWGLLGLNIRPGETGFVQFCSPFRAGHGSWLEATAPWIARIFGRDCFRFGSICHQNVRTSLQ